MNKLMNSREEFNEWNKTCQVRDYVIDADNVTIMRRIKPDAKFKHFADGGAEVIFFSNPYGSTAMIQKEEAKELLAAAEKITDLPIGKTIWVGNAHSKRLYKVTKHTLSYHPKQGRGVNIIGGHWGGGFNTSGKNSHDDSWIRLRIALTKFINDEPMGETIPLVLSRTRIQPLLNRSSGVRFPIVVVTQLGAHRGPNTGIRIYGAEPGEGIRIVAGRWGDAELPLMAPLIDMWCEAITKITDDPEKEPFLLRSGDSKYSKAMEYISTSKWWAGTPSNPMFRVVMNGDYTHRATKWSFIHQEQFTKDLIAAMKVAAECIDALPSREEGMSDPTCF